LPDPIITCQVLGGPISYDPPADTSGADVTITAEPGAAVSDCTDNTPNLISGASISGSFLLPGFDCEVSPAGTEVGSGTGTLGWSNGRQSVFTATFFSPGTPGRFLLELEITSGLWAGATASLILQVVSSVGDCWTTPVTEAVLAATGPFVLSSPKQPLPDIVQVAAGTSHSCALTATGTVKCWGSNQYGQLGNGATPGSMSTSPVDVTGVTGAVEVTAGDFHSCALIDDGSVRCWGFGGRGELGDGTGVSSSTPVTVEGIDTATDISQGLAHTCVLLPGGSAKCWGYNLWGSLGDGSNTNRNSPVDVVGLSGATSLAAGGDVACALHGIDGAECWGRNGHGQLGDGTTVGRNTPVPVVGLSGPPSDMAIGRYHSCALIVGGTVQCWGANYSGQLGNGSNSGSISPVGVTGLTDAVVTGAGWDHSCAVRSGGSVACWGANAQGQLGNGGTTPSNTPVSVVGIADAESVSANGHTCVSRPTDTVLCWGSNLHGQVGDGTTVDRYFPVAVVDGS
jgi:alpha-tubulin suppressor-like RCC1 family protein